MNVYTIVYFVKSPNLYKSAPQNADRHVRMIACKGVEATLKKYDELCKQPDVRFKHVVCPDGKTMDIGLLSMQHRGYDYRIVDTVGGVHEDGLGWNPNGHFCGECTYSTCEACTAWLDKA